MATLAKIIKDKIDVVCKNADEIEKAMKSAQERQLHFVSCNDAPEGGYRLVFWGYE